MIPVSQSLTVCSWTAQFLHSSSGAGPASPQALAIDTMSTPRAQILEYCALLLATCMHVLLPPSASAQAPVIVTGVVVDSITGAPLPFATVRVEGASAGAVAGRDGRFRLRMPTDGGTLVVSYVGFERRRVSASMSDSQRELRILMTPSVARAPAVVISPEDPAKRLLRKAIERKIAQRDSLESYSHVLYTRFVASTDTTTAGRGVGRGDTTIVSIFESYSRGFYRRPDQFFNEIIQRRQTANIPPQGNMVVFGTNLNAYEDFVTLLGEEVYTPFHPNALDFYDVNIAYLTRMDDSTTVAHLRVTPTSDARRAFAGSIDLDTRTFAPLKVDFVPNRAVQLPFDAALRYQQTFGLADMRYVVPSGMHIAASLSADILWIFSPRLDINIETIAYDYIVNPPLADELFEQRRVEAGAESAEYDTTFWAANEVLPLGEAEKNAYDEIRNYIESPDSSASDGGGALGRLLGEVPRLVGRLNRRPFTGVEDVFRYNRVHGPYLGFGLSDEIVERVEGTIRGGYGVSDKRWYGEVGARFWFDRAKRFAAEAIAYHRLARRDNPWMVTAQAITPLALLFGSDYGDYYYSNGFEGAVEIGFGQLRFLRRDRYIRPTRIRAFLRNEQHQTASNRTMYSLFGGPDPFRPNPGANDGAMRSVGGEISLSYAPGRRFGNIGLQLTGEVSHPSVIASDFDFQQYTMAFYLRTRTMPLWQLDVRLSGGLSAGSVPPQRFFSLESAVASVAGEAAFRGMSVKEFYGDRFVSLAIEHNFGEVIPGILRIPNIASFGIEFIMQGRIGWTDFSRRTIEYTRTLLASTQSTDDRIYYEGGVGINRLLFFFRIDVSARFSQTDLPSVRLTFSGATN